MSAFLQPYPGPGSSSVVIFLGKKLSIPEISKVALQCNINRALTMMLNKVSIGTREEARENGQSSRELAISCKKLLVTMPLDIWLQKRVKVSKTKAEFSGFG